VGGNVRWVAGTESARSIPLGVFAHMVGVYTAHDPVTFMSAAREALLAPLSSFPAANVMKPKHDSPVAGLACRGYRGLT
ncbi:hypothetical protein, partial [Nocardia cyriacigeorgica]|uniref:hypothetical protein n=1 Tax=Nocardia cyriacigeorgica TaxID=135487 RepID=UPI002457C606